MFEKIYDQLIFNAKKYIIPILPKFNGINAYNYALMNNSIKERFSGSIGNIKSLENIKNKLSQKNIQYKVDSFIKETPIGKVKFNNLVVDLKGKNKNFIIVGVHHDSKFFPTYKDFSGANDGSSGVGLLLELIIHFSKIQNQLQYGLKFIFFDGQECFYQYNKYDGLFGSKYAAKLYGQNCEYVIIADMIGGNNLNIQFQKDNDKQLLFLTKKIVKKFEYQNFFSEELINPITDDHKPFKKLNIPTIDFIQMNYQFWHTNQDTIDKISANSIQIVGNVIVQLLRQLLNK